MDDNIKRRNRNRNRNKRNPLYKVLTYLFCIIIAVFALVSIVIPDKKYSEEENRVLAEFPAISWESIMNTKFMTGLESYISDHFVGRDLWINIKVKCDLLLGKSELNGVYLCDDNYLM